MKREAQNIVIIVLVSICVIWSVWHSYTRFYVEKDFLILQHVSCDPETENCFVWQCDPAAEECTGNPEEDTEYYKILEKKAANIPECSIEEECEESFCEIGETDCIESLCTPEAAELEEAVCSSDLEESETTEGSEEEELTQGAEIEQESDPEMIEETPE